MKTQLKNKAIQRQPIYNEARGDGNVYESSDEMKNSYIIIDSQGNISTNNAHISNISIFDYDLEEAINLLNIDYANYIKRYI